MSILLAKPVNGEGLLWTGRVPRDAGRGGALCLWVCGDSPASSPRSPHGSSCRRNGAPTYRATGSHRPRAETRPEVEPRDGPCLHSRSELQSNLRQHTLLVIKCFFPSQHRSASPSGSRRSTLFIAHLPPPSSPHRLDASPEDIMPVTQFDFKEKYRYQNGFGCQHEYVAYLSAPPSSLTTKNNNAPTDISTPALLQD